MDAPSRALFERKTQALGMARATAEAEGRAPNLTDYWRAALTMPELEGNASKISDLSGQTLDGFTIRYEDIYPDQATLDSMRDVQGPKIEPGANNGIRNLRNFLDADGNGTIEPEEISDFYREVQANMNFSGAQFHNVTFQPATTLEIFSHANGAQFANITLDGLGAGETLTIGTQREHPGANRESYANVRLINDQGGIIRVNSNATVNGLALENGNTVLEVAGGGQVNQLQVTGETVALVIQPQGQLFLPSFEGATFTPSSSMRGAILRGNMMDDRFYGFRNCDLTDLSFENATISGTSFEGSTMKNVSFRGARLSDTTMKNVDLSSVDFTGVSPHNLTIENNGISTRIDSIEQLNDYVKQQSVMNQAAAIGRDVFAPALATIGQTVAPVLSLENAAAAISNEPRVAAAAASTTARIVTASTPPLDETPAQMVARLGGALTDNFGQAVEDVNLNHVRPLEHNTAESRAAQAEARVAQMERNDQLTVIRG